MRLKYSISTNGGDVKFLNIIQNKVRGKIINSNYKCIGYAKNKQK